MFNSQSYMQKDFNAFNSSSNMNYGQGMGTNSFNSLKGSNLGFKAQNGYADEIAKVINSTLEPYISRIIEQTSENVYYKFYNKLKFSEQEPDLDIIIDKFDYNVNKYKDKVKKHLLLLKDSFEIKIQSLFAKNNEFVKQIEKEVGNSCKNNWSSIVSRLNEINVSLIECLNLFKQEFDKALCSSESESEERLNLIKDKIFVFLIEIKEKYINITNTKQQSKNTNNNNLTTDNNTKKSYDCISSKLNKLNSILNKKNKERLLQIENAISFTLIKTNKINNNNQKRNKVDIEEIPCFNKKIKSSFII